MGSDWAKVKVDDIASVNKGAIAIGPFGSRMKSDCYVAEGIPVIRGLNISSTKLFVDNFVYISADKASTLGNANVYPGDIVFPHRGAIGQVAIVPNDDIGHYVLSSSLMKLTVNTELANPEFVVYFFRSPGGKHEILQYASTVGTPGIGQPLTSLRAMELPLPPLSEQNAIAHVLGSLDDRIQLNRQMNETLEAMAQALFESWFVDFDPVIDNALAGGKEIPAQLSEKAQARAALGDKRRPLPEEIRTLFPDEFTCSDELGWIPKGWEETPFGEFTVEVKDKVGKRDVPEYSSTNQGLVPRAVNFKKQLSKSKAKNKLVSKGDIVFGMSRKVLNFGLMHDEIGSVSSAYNVFKIDSTVIFPEFVEDYMRTRNTIYYNMLGSSSREGQSLSKEHFKKTSMLVPASGVQEVYQERTDFIFKQLIHNIKGNNTLSNLRDTLLPKLLSGEIRIPDAEKMVEELAL